MNDVNSVHLKNTVNVEAIHENENLINALDLAREVCSIGLSIRKKFNLRLRLPLNKVTIMGQGAMGLSLYSEVIKQELNLKHVVLNPNIDGEVEVRLKLNSALLGKKLGGKFKDILQEAKNGNFQRLANGGVMISGEVITPDMFEVEMFPKNNNDVENYANCGGEVFIVLDTNITKELEMEGLARDGVRAIQNIRKESGLDITDRISIKYITESNINKQAIEAFTDYIKTQTLCDEITFVEGNVVDMSGFIQTEIGDNFVFFSIVKV